MVVCTKDGTHLIERLSDVTRKRQDMKYRIHDTDVSSAL